MESFKKKIPPKQKEKKRKKMYRKITIDYKYSQT